MYEDKYTGKMPEDIALEIMKEFTNKKADLEKTADCQKTSYVT